MATQYLEGGLARGAESNVATPGLMRNAEMQKEQMQLGVFPGNQGQGQMGGSLAAGNLPPGVSHTSSLVGSC